MTTARLRLVEWAERGMPVLTRAIATPAVRGVVVRPAVGGEEYSLEAAPTGLVVYFTDIPGTARWLAGSIAARLGCVVLVPDAKTMAGLRRDADSAGRTGSPAADLVSRVIADRGLDPARVAIVGEGDAAETAIEACTGIRLSRLALLYPAAVEVGQPASVPTTLLQAASKGPGRAAVVALDRALRQAGVAVRETEYDSVPDGWARHPKLVSGSNRALGDLVAFLERGFGTQSTFEVIPGWDLH